MSNISLHKKHYFRFFLITIATIFYFLANIQRVAIPGAIFNLLQNDFMAKASDITMLGAIFCYVYAFVQLIVGLMVDKIGGFRVIAIGSVIFSLGVIIFPFAQNINILYLSRAMVGFGAATFYLSSVREVKKFAKDENFSLAISYILFIGYSGGVIANAPFVMFVNQIGWKTSLFYLALFSLFLCVIYLITLFIFRPVVPENKVEFSFLPFKEILSKKENLIIFLFGSTNYGLYYVLQSVIGKKFLEDFCNYDINSAAFILSMMAIVSACAGTITAFISKMINNRRAIIFKTFAAFSFLSSLIVFLLLIFNIQTKLIALIFAIPSFIGSISPLLIMSLHKINRYEVSATAVSIQNFGFFMTVGLLGMVTGMLMNVFKPVYSNGSLIYSSHTYCLVFGLFLIISIVEVIASLQIKD